RVAALAVIDHRHRRFVVQRDRVGIDPVAHLVAVEQGEDRIELGRGDLEVRPGDDIALDSQAFLGPLCDPGRSPRRGGGARPPTRSLPPCPCQIGSRWEKVTGTEEGEAIARRRIEAWLVSLALGRPHRRPPLSALPIGLERDLRSFFGSYAAGCRRADDLL